jgi:hypothetical protein
MKLSRNDIFTIAKKPHNLVWDNCNGEIIYDQWVKFIDAHPQDFVWNENTKSGIEALGSSEKVPDNFRERVLASLRKNACYKEFDKQKGLYNINIAFNHEKQRVSIGFERIPKLEDLKIFLQMAKYLDGLLLKDGTEIIDEKVIRSFT